jgi:hypothetical protein
MRKLISIKEPLWIYALWNYMFSFAWILQDSKLQYRLNYFLKEEKSSTMYLKPVYKRVWIISNK